MRISKEQVKKGLEILTPDTLIRKPKYCQNIDGVPMMCFNGAVTSFMHPEFECDRVQDYADCNLSDEIPYDLFKELNNIHIQFIDDCSDSFYHKQDTPDPQVYIDRAMRLVEEFDFTEDSYIVEEELDEDA